MNTEIIIAFEVEGFHNYPDAPSKVRFLSYTHRHTFHITCYVHATHDNRDKEIFLYREQVLTYIRHEYGSPAMFGSMSCEMIAKDILKQFSNADMRSVEVWEENTGGAKVSI